MRTYYLAVTGLVLIVAACSSYGTSVVEVNKTPARVASVSVVVPPSLAAGQKARCAAITKDSTGAVLTGRPISWSTSSASIASVTDSGMISAVAPGTAVVSATSEGVAGQATVAVTPPPPTPIVTVSVAISPSSVLVGQTAHATATLLDSSGNQILGRTVAWQSSNSGIATVTQAGDLAAVSPGTAMISASSGGVSASSALSVSAPAPVAVASVSVSPSSVSLVIGATVQLSAVTRDANNNVLTGRVIGWNSANSAIAGISTSGLVTAVAAGSVSITVSSEGQTASAAITVSAPAPVPVATVSVSPSSSSLVVGATGQLSATTRDPNGNVLTGRVVAWSSGNAGIASVNSSGLVTAVSAGTTQVTATSEGQSGTSSLTVTVPPPPPPPGSSNEPAGMTLLTERPFNSLTEDAGWITQGLSIAQDASAPKSPTSVIRATYPAGFVGGSAPGVAEFSHAGHRVIYISYWAKLSSNFWGHLTSVNKQLYEWGNGIGLFYFEASGVGSDPLVPRVVLQGTPADAVLDPNLVPTATIPRGVWYQVEIVLNGNSSGAADGTVDWWLNGVHVGSYSGRQFTSGATVWGIFQFQPIWGGITDAVPATMTQDWDHLYISGKN